MRPRKSVAASLERVRRRTNLWIVADGVLVWPRSNQGRAAKGVVFEYFSAGR